MNWLLRLFGMKDDAGLTVPCPHCGQKMARPARVTAVDLYMDGRIDVEELERRLGRPEPAPVAYKAPEPQRALVCPCERCGVRVAAFGNDYCDRCKDRALTEVYGGSLVPIGYAAEAEARKRRSRAG